MIYYNPNDSKYYHTTPVIGNSETVDPGGSKAVPENTVPYAYFHTHAAPTDNIEQDENFSPPDKKYALDKGIDGYLRTSRNVMKHYDIYTKSETTLNGCP